MFDYDDVEISNLETYLNNNGYKLDKKSECYCKNPISVLLNENSPIIIKDFINNRRFNFEPTSSQEIIINFLKYLEKELVLV